ncbi:unnamed protein product [Prunus armeniaca]|uniref:Uncharacterized protein n=1 Tax=Prunus armeniaca TaxID=36596 RepID=A0A6J5UR04_PRUAR|nr:unnamed protein product [Prunus armeniaca]
MASNFLMGDVNLSLSNNSHIETNEAEEDRMLWLEMQLLKSSLMIFYTAQEKKNVVLELFGLSITMYCGHKPCYSEMLPDIQELASQGMSIVYELGDASMKENLLVEDSEVFQEGVMVKVLVEGNSARIRSFAT